MAVSYNLKTIIEPAQLTTSAAEYYTVPTNTKCELRKLTFTNNSAAAVLVTVYLIPSGGSASDTTAIKKTRSLAPAGISGDSWNCPEAVGHCLGAGSEIQALCSANTAVSIRGTGMEIVG